MQTRPVLLSAIFLCLVTPTMFAQKQSPEDRLTTARALYYTPTVAGLNSFGCRVSFDWKDFLTKTSGKEIADDNAFLKYLASAHMSVKDNLRGDGKLEWANTATPAEGLADAASQVQQGLVQMFDGFFQTWNAYMNGGMVPTPDKTITLTAVADGVHLHGTADKIVLDEDFDKNMLLTKAHVLTGEMDVVALPVFIDTPDGRLVSEVHSEVKEPISAPPMLVDIGVDYQTVSKYRIPEIIHYNVRNVAQMEFKLTDCTVNSETSQSPATSIQK